MGVGAGFCMYDVVVKKFTFAISSPDEFLYHWQWQHYFVCATVPKKNASTTGAINRGAKYCDECICISVCLSVCLSARISKKIPRPNFTKFSVRVTCGCSSILLRRERNMCKATAFIFLEHFGYWMTVACCWPCAASFVESYIITSHVSYQVTSPSAADAASAVEAASA